MIVVDSYIAPSHIHGNGLFSSALIPNGSIVWVYDPVVDIIIPSNLVNNLNDNFKEYIVHFSVLMDNGQYILSSDNSIYLNHSDDPCIVKYGPLGFGVAVRDIPANTEITTNYSEWSSHTPTVLW